ncbi:MAG: tRNA pseudouridine(55) synthase TruB [Balneolaceae bacterium]
MAKPLPLDTIPVFSKENPPTPEFDYNDGAILLVNKEKTWTSFDAVKFIRSRVKTKKVGHAGTLDPMATGLLILCTGKATKSISQLQDMSKTYVGEITFGGSTPSYDADSDVDEKAPFDHITREKIEEILKNQFLGDIQQIPPMYSALKRDGKKLYELARRGKTVELEPRPVTIHNYQVIEYLAPKLIVCINCSKGTYIRSIAHDLGLALNSRGYLSALERTQIGEYSSANAYTPHQIDDLLKEDG